MIMLRDVIDRIARLAEGRGYRTTAYANHLIIHNGEFKADITVIDDNMIIIQTRGFPRDDISIVKVRDLLSKSDEELARILNL